MAIHSDAGRPAHRVHDASSTEEALSASDVPLAPFDAVADEQYDEIEDDVNVAVLLPCLNEEATIGKVVGDFRRALPTAAIYVYDNGSTDRTGAVARAAGAIVRRVPVRGKGNVVRRMFAEVDATVYVVADGDDTYDASIAPALIRRLRRDHLDMVVGRRVEETDVGEAYRRGHRLGNRLLTRSVQSLFGAGPQDMLSGYRAVSRRYVKSFPAISRGFEAETEMSIHALELSLPFAEVPSKYVNRPAGSISKLRTIPDGLKILRFILKLFKDYRPLPFFGSLALAIALVAVAAGALTRANPHSWTPATVAIVGLCELVIILPLVGVILDAVNRGRRETSRLLYLAVLVSSTIEKLSDAGRERKRSFHGA